MRDLEASACEPGLRLTTAVSELPGVGKRRAQALGRLGIVTVTDLLRHTPMRYEKEAAEGAIGQLPTDGKTVGTARGEVVACRWVPGQGYGRKGRFEATLSDLAEDFSGLETPTAGLVLPPSGTRGGAEASVASSLGAPAGGGSAGSTSEGSTSAGSTSGGGTLRLTWFNAGYLRERIHAGMRLRVSGKAKMFGPYPQMVGAKWEVLEDEAASPTAKADRLRPVYPATEGLASTVIERVVEEALPWALTQVVDPLPEELLTHHAMPSLGEALRMMHRPADREEPKAARRRLAFNELLLLQLGIAMRRAEVEQKCAAPALHYSEAIDAHIRERFPFALTDTQSAAVAQLAEDLTRERPMNRMLQGDVGSGKTVVALYALLMAVADRKQGALMAPTELLAEQHYLSITALLAGSNVRVALVTGNQREDLGAVASGEADVVVGTHALLSASVTFRDLAVVVIDEQHRFGVMQRASLRQPMAEDPGGTDGRSGRRERMPHTLVMTATPIPRTLSLTLLGDLDNTTLTGLPPGRTPVQNRVVGPGQSDEVYTYLRTRLERGEQAYVVVPAIEARGGGESAQTLKSVRAQAELLREKFLAGYEVAAVHGKLKRETRQRVMERFRRGEVAVLVATTVIEVGVDVPNATVMVIEHAERFGLAQLHQLRGRVGRGGGRRSLCVFVAEPTTEDAEARMDAVASTNDGFKIAELDLQIRGMGEILGTRQSGLPAMKHATIPGDLDLLQLAKRDAAAIVAGDPELTAPEHAGLRRVLTRLYGEALGLVDVG
ncbi:MAG: ATP-dependent DNA helicase RecG [Planctomycetota bacterium]